MSRSVGQSGDTADQNTGIHWQRAIPWALYDCANSAFATSVMAGFVPIFNKEYWNAGAEHTVSSFRLSVAVSAAGLLVALMAPLLGAIADRGGARKKFLLFFAGQGIVMTGALHFIARGQWIAGLTVYALALAGFSGANVFYDSLLLGVARENKFDIVSAVGYALGYVGGGLLFAVNVFMVKQPDVFGLADAQEAIRWAFLTVAVWWAVFSLPLLLWVPEPIHGDAGKSSLAILKAGLRQLRESIREIRLLRAVPLFLVGYWLYIDGVGTVIQMAVDYGEALGFATEDLITALLITQFVGFPAALFFGKLGERVGAKKGILAGLAVYIGVCIWAYRMQSPGEFYILAVAVGMVQGGVQSLSRSLYARLIPHVKAGEYFGIYNMIGKFAAIIGPVLMGITGLVTKSSRASILSIIVLFVGGAAFLLRVRMPRDA